MFDRKELLRKYTITDRKSYLEAVRHVNKYFIGNLRRRYVRDRNGNPVGVVVLIDDNKIGYSLCHKNDTFNKQLGFFMAATCKSWVHFKDIGMIPHSCQETARLLTCEIS